VNHTTLSLAAIALTVLLELLVLRTGLLTRAVYWTAYAIVAFFQLLTNEWLTSRGVFRYDPDAILGWRVGSAPVEDFAFGFALVTQSMLWWVWWGRRGVQREQASGHRRPSDERAPGRPTRP
jgi:lycopene cyclase domain-containing protein